MSAEADDPSETNYGTRIEQLVSEPSAIAPVRPPRHADPPDEPRSSRRVMRLRCPSWLFPGES